MFQFACRPLLAGVVVLGLLGGATPAIADSLEMQINGWTNPPVGYIDFCRKFSTECTTRGSTLAEPLSERRWRDLQEVNTLVNHLIVPATDRDLYKTDEVWTLPEAYGDCEDYVLLKRKWLIERGWPSGALLVTVVFDEVGDGHAVLLARTSRGDFVLDNKTDTLRRWYETAYHFVKRQSVRDPNRWVSVGDPRWSAQSTAAPR
ncbi:MAG: transglutaminase-like cysteine peptidase [Propylenella sp.]